MLVRHRALGVGVDLVGAAEQAVAVFDRAHQIVLPDRGPAGVADEVGLVRLPRGL